MTENKSKKINPAWLILILIVIIGAVAFGIFYFQAKDELIQQDKNITQPLSENNQKIPDAFAVSKTEIFKKLNILVIAGKYGAWPIGPLNLEGRERGNPFAGKK